MNNRHFLNAVWNARLESPVEKFVLVALAQNATQDGVARMSISRIVSTTSLSELSIYRAILGLDELGWLTYQCEPLLQMLSGTPVCADTGRPLEDGAREFLREYIVSVEDEKSPREYSQLVPNDPWVFLIKKSPEKQSAALSGTAQE